MQCLVAHRVLSAAQKLRVGPGLLLGRLRRPRGRPLVASLCQSHVPAGQPIRAASHAQATAACHNRQDVPSSIYDKCKREIATDCSCYSSTAVHCDERDMGTEHRMYPCRMKSSLNSTTSGIRIKQSMEPAHLPCLPGSRAPLGLARARAPPPARPARPCWHTFHCCCRHSCQSYDIPKPQMSYAYSNIVDNTSSCSVSAAFRSRAA